MRRRRLLIAAASVWLLLGLLGAAAHMGLVRDLGYGILMLAALPLYWMSARIYGPGVSHGLLWGSAHSPPFLNPAGVLVVFILPAVLGLVWIVLRGRPERRDP